ncbi:uncharacterized protein LOC127284357 [Leptopilina boulardi]|uniref:uncharacterized protein LOC127284357 n=1 Tax=Leptopilina boulardi TaxID=63433 RepID=UPI0021F5D285|nr:uncharacterized protein LOC127284357 [Leptopilina boulardi]
MPRKLMRSKEDEEEVQRIRREKNAERQRRYRSNIKSKNINQVEVRKQNAERQRCFRVRHKINVQNVPNNIEINSQSTSQRERGNYKGLYSFNDCCGHGGVILDSMSNDFPSELKSLLDGSHSKSRSFHSKIRGYNNSFSFASLNANVVKFNGRRPGPYCYKIQGQIYYQMNNALYPEEGDNPSFGQLFIYDANESIERRLNQNNQLDVEILTILETTMRNFNVFSKSYKMMSEVIEIENQLAIQRNEQLPELQLLFTLKKGMDHRRFNFQRTNEVAAIFKTNSEGEIPESYVTVYNNCSKSLQIVSSLDPNVEPWTYPIFYPLGNKGYDINMLRVDRDNRSKKHKVSRADYLKYRIALRDEFNQFLLGGRLFQQWLVDNYVKIEKDRLLYFRNNQLKIRAESYKGLIDHLQHRADDIDTHVGKLVVLPSTFIGSPRNMTQLYQDSMAIVGKHGKPDLFITMTCNPKWKEIEENLLPNQTASDRPDIVGRVFALKVDYSVDRYISAEIPDENLHPLLHSIVIKNNIHGPCGDWCLKDNKCSKHFPKDFNSETTFTYNSFVNYRRRDTGKSYTRPSGYIVDNRHVVPYCRELTFIFNCHINVEVVSSIDSVKYLYKYIYKGHDAAAILITDSNGNITLGYDEIKQYEENRYVGPVEAYWRIACKNLFKKSHSITRLPVHLPEEQNIIISETNNGNNVSFNVNKKSKLVDYFDLNVRDLDACNFYYTEIPEYYTWKEKDSKWVKRKGFDNTIGRMYSVNPCQVELFHLRLLLLSTKGKKSFEDLCTVNGVFYDTFSSTCLALGLIEDDDEWRRALSDGALWKMPQSLRRLFVRILIHCQPINPHELWNEFKDKFSEDYSRNFGTLEAQNMFVTWHLLE